MILVTVQDAPVQWAWQLYNLYKMLCAKKYKAVTIEVCVRVLCYPHNHGSIMLSALNAHTHTHTHM